MANGVTLAVLNERTTATDKRVATLEETLRKLVFFQAATLVSVLLTLLALVFKNAY